MARINRDVISINDLSNDEIKEIFALADLYCESMTDAAQPYRIRGRRSDASPFILATLFYEPSTRTRFSFEAAMIRLGGNVIGSSDPATTSAKKGESLADTVRVIQNYADAIVLRHPSEGAARAAAEFADIPIINGGDGSHEHPTQTLCDLYTLEKERGHIEGLNVAVVGDLKNGRTVHSLVYALARFKANIIAMPAPGLELPAEVSQRLENEFLCKPIFPEQLRTLAGPKSTISRIDAVYQAPTEKRQLTLFGSDDVDQKTLRAILEKQDVYVTRFQNERLIEKDKRGRNYARVDEKFLRAREYKHARVLHPLPRVDELGYELDEDPRGVYFKQAGYGVPIRMALISKVLGIEPFKSVSIGKLKPRIYSGGGDRLCSNPRCITHHPVEQKLLPHKAVCVSNGSPFQLRCLYCESPVDFESVGFTKTGLYKPKADLDELPEPEEIKLFGSEKAARRARFHREGSVETRKESSGRKA